MSYVNRCDVCRADYGKVNVKYRVKAGFWIHCFAGSMWERFDICDKCIEKVKSLRIQDDVPEETNPQP
jgi:hypothetical protein